MKLNGFQSKNVEEDKIVPQLKEAANGSISTLPRKRRWRESKFLRTGSLISSVPDIPTAAAVMKVLTVKVIWFLIWAQAMPAASKNQPRPSNRWKTKFV